MDKRNEETRPVILLVDNDPLNREIVKDMLEHCGCRVHVAGNGHEAVDACSRESFDMMFLECLTPEMDGFATAESIRSMEAKNPGGTAGKKIPMVALCASSAAGGSEAILRSGMDDCLAKPCRIADIQAMLDKWLAARREEGGASDAQGRESSPAIDHEALEMLASLQPQGAKELLTKLITVYLDSSSKQMKGILDAVNSHDITALLTAAHTLKSSSASLGAVNFAEQCRELEMMARSGVIDGAGNRVAPLEHEYDRVRDSLAHYLASL
ncbi:response regulator [Syntrophus sp. (in: bacteria)]|uniref:response regulator n=1 Tax=Syntrophus sp. (in: bacteria) TaxID=48412 RepID=UPI00345EE024